MNNLSTQNEEQTRDRFAALLAKRRNYQQEIKSLTDQYSYIVFYGCGAIFSSIVDTWKDYVGRNIDYCCDSNSEKWGKYFCGIRCLSPAELLEIRDRCAVFVTIGQFKPVWEFLTAIGFPSVNLIFKYDLVSSNFLVDHDPCEIATYLCRTRESLSDERSRKVFDAIVNRVLQAGNRTDLMVDICEPHQYFPADIIRLSDHENFVDIGAFDGDTIKEYVERTQGRFDRIFSFEIDRVNFRLLQDNVQRLPKSDRIRIFNIGIWDCECDLAYSIGKSQSTIGDGEGRGHVIPLDTVLRDEKVSFIKMDIEGAELHALRGARNLIQTWKPRLAISIYHHIKHLWEIPLYIKELVPEYKLYLRHHTNLEYETVCYAVI